MEPLATPGGVASRGRGSSSASMRFSSCKSWSVELEVRRKHTRVFLHSFVGPSSSTLFNFVTLSAAVLCRVSFAALESVREAEFACHKTQRLNGAQYRCPKHT